MDDDVYSQQEIQKHGEKRGVGVGSGWKIEQEAHGPHRLPEKQFKSINTYNYIMTLIKRRKK